MLAIEAKRQNQTKKKENRSWISRKKMWKKNTQKEDVYRIRKKRKKEE